MVDRMAPPEFIDESRPSLSDIRKWPLIALLFLGFSAFGVLVWWITSGEAEPVENRRASNGQEIAVQKPLAGFPTDYTQIQQPAPAPAPKPDPNPDPAPKPPGAPTPAPNPAPAQTRVVTGGGGKSWRQEAREGDTQLLTINRSRGSLQESGGGMVAGMTPPGAPGGTGGAPGGSGGGIYSSARLTGPVAGQVNARTPIRAHTEQPIATDAPGYVTALVIGDVYTADKSCVAIPHGSRLYGEANGDVQEGQVKVTVVWTHLNRPQPRNDTIELSRVVGADRDGTPGISGSVNNHWLRKFGFILASSAIDIGTAALGSRRGGGNQLVIGGTVAENARSPLDEFAKRQLDIPPTIEVEPKEISVMLSQHLPLDCFDQR